MVGRRGQAVEETALRQNGGTPADRRHDGHFVVHGAHPLDQPVDLVLSRRVFCRILLAERPSDSPAAGHHQDVEWLRRADDDLPVHGGHPARSEQLWQAVRTARDALGVPDVTTHSFRKTVADLIDDEGLSARVGADQLGHSHVSMTQDKYMTRGRVHPQVADLLDRAVISAE